LFFLSLSELFGVIPSTLFGILSLSENGSRWTGQQSRDGGRVDFEKPSGVGVGLVALGNHLSDLGLLLKR